MLDELQGNSGKRGRGGQRGWTRKSWENGGGGSKV